MKIHEDIIYKTKNKFYHLYDKFYFDFEKDSNYNFNLIPNWHCHVIKNVIVKIEVDSGNNIHTLDKFNFDCFSRELMFLNIGNYCWDELIPRNWLKNEQNYIYGLQENKEDYYIEIIIIFNEWQDILKDTYIKENLPLKKFTFRIEYIDTDSLVILNDYKIWLERKEAYKKDPELQKMIEGINKL